MDELERHSLDYADPDVLDASWRRDSIEYHRERPAIAEWTINGIVAWTAVYIALEFMLLWAIGWRFSF